MGINVTTTGGSSNQSFIALEGDKELMAWFRTVEDSLQKKVLRRAMRNAAQPIAKQAKANVRRKSGDLSKSIKVRAKKRNKRGIVGVSVATSKDDNLFKGNQFYGAFQEFGTSTIAGDGAIRSAFDHCSAASIRIIGESVRLGLADLASGNKGWSRLGKEALSVQPGD